MHKKKLRPAAHQQTQGSTTAPKLNTSEIQLNLVLVWFYEVHPKYYNKFTEQSLQLLLQPQHLKKNSPKSLVICQQYSKDK